MPATNLYQYPHTPPYYVDNIDANTGYIRCGYNGRGGAVGEKADRNIFKGDIGLMREFCHILNSENLRVYRNVVRALGCEAEV